MLAAARLAQGAVAHAFADPAAARAALLDAVALFTAVDAPYERAQALLLLARCLAGTERAAAATPTPPRRSASPTASAPGRSASRHETSWPSSAPPRRPAAATFAGLTSREAEILRLIARGAGNHDIAAQLVISVRTVERHVSNIYLKLGLEGPAAQASAATAALRHGLV